MFGDSCRFSHSVGLSGLTLRQSPPEDSGQDEEKQGIEPLWLPADLTVDICTGADVQDDAWDEDNDFSNWQHEDREAWGTDNTSAWHCGKSARQVHREWFKSTCKKSLWLNCTQQEASLNFSLRIQVECGICLDRVLSKTLAADRRFGLLACDHPFCLSCIRSWRATGEADLDSAVRTCPLCRVTTHFVVPSTIWPESQEEKDAILAGYKSKLGSIDCRHFAQGSGSCPFGTSCFYRHAYPDGTVDTKDPATLRRYMDKEGDVRIIGGVRLSDFLELGTRGQRILDGATSHRNRRGERAR
ncbi:hypothetical protein CEUSTIGMA_g12841.t1 [Chlamydomonas eustigma]|uniref:Uncharacterized protein n=1 Tax=Chlamydomonas eustigma TaxID=1157962 RepID=A0A250XQU2_9CHLO|nr:hypothetical protein CEUSTIGMA_g12841.t1 [Chlamydomonas eustigma]|eukprot:GAX85425.1 hypothetical protein CEUSTIGMA_g12841.t1 [Chlamydomonas eustigma]